MLTVNILLMDSWTTTDRRKKPRRIIRWMHEKRSALFAVCKILYILYLHFWDWDPSIWWPFNTFELWVWPMGTWTIIYLLWFWTFLATDHELTISWLLWREIDTSWTKVSDCLINNSSCPNLSSCFLMAAYAYYTLLDAFLSRAYQWSTLFLWWPLTSSWAEMNTSLFSSKIHTPSKEDYLEIFFFPYIRRET
jgi:hypothetical protein